MEKGKLLIKLYLGHQTYLINGPTKYSNIKEVNGFVLEQAYVKHF